MSNPYANYFYLFNEPPSEGSLIYKEAPSAGGEFTTSNEIPVESTVVGGNILDCPNASTISLRTSSFDSKLQNLNLGSYIIAGTDGVTPLEKKISRDPSSNPGNKSIIDIFGRPTYSYHTNYGNPYRFYFNFTGDALNDSTAKMRNGYGDNVNQQRADRYTTLKLKGDVKDFKFSQKMKLRVEDLQIQGDKSNFSFQSQDGGTTAQSIKDFFTIYALSIPGQSYIVDTNTLVGVPYDYDTILDDKPQAKSMGVVSRQPFYHQVYNYYDAQYEPVAIDIIENNISDEKAFPSIYDFLYMPVQEKLGAFLMMPGMSYDEINLAGLNRYLDTFARAYETYLQQPVSTTEEAFTVDVETGVIETNFPGMGGKPIPLGTLLGESDTISKEDLLSDSLTKIKATSHTVALKSLAALAADKEQINNIKKTAYPQWINDLKTGVYFSENSYDLFNQALDKEFAFPYFIKVDIPTETVGPLARIFKENNLLDNLNSYVASKTLPTTGQDAVYSDYYGSIVSGEAIGLNNAVDNLKLNNIKLILSPKPESVNIPTETEAQVPDPSIPGANTGTGNNTLDVLGNLDALTSNNPNQNQQQSQKTETPPTGVDVPVEYSNTNWYKKMDPALAGVLNLMISQKLKEAESVQTIAKRLSFVQVKKNLGGNIDINDSKTKAALLKEENNILNSITPQSVPSFRNAGWYINAGILFEPNAEIFSPSATEGAHEVLDLIVTTEIMNYEPVKTAIADLKSEGSVPDPYLPLQKKEGLGTGTGLGFYNPLLTKATAETIVQGTDTDKLKDVIESAKKTMELNWGQLLDPVNPVDIYLDDLVENVFEGVFVYEDEGDENALPAGDFGKLIKKLRVQNLKKQMSQLLIKDTTGLLRGPGEILDGELAHNETLMYEIAKYRIEQDGTETYIQSIFLPITHQEKLSYYDTQVIPFQDYFYKIFSHKAILGTRYRIGRDKEFNVDLKDVGYEQAADGTYFSKLELTYEVEPYIELVRVPYYNTTTINLANDVINYTRIEDTPPLPPQVNFVPYRNVRNKVLILLQNSLGEYEAYPRVIYPGTDQEIFNNVYSSQDRPLDSKVLFKSDDSQGVFEIFRLETQPESYIDFQNTPTPDITELNYFGSSRQDSFVDTLEPNKDYYYTARFVDIHGNISNPTDIYKIKIIDEIGAMAYMTIDVMDIREMQKNTYKKQFPPTKKMRKYLYMKPNFIQTSIVPPEVDAEIDGSYADYPVKLGADFVGEGGINPSIFGKKFKLRITSKQTGKKIDINLNVKEPQEIIINE